MPTKPESPAAASARREASMWADLADAVGSGGVSVIGETTVIPEVDPASDLARRTRRWSHRLPTNGLGDLCRFAAGLASAEADSWDANDPIIATRANEDRRFLFGDRIVHWAVPVLVAANVDAQPLLGLGDVMRPAPSAAVGEGLQLPGHDMYGPADEPRDIDDRLASLWGGWVPGVSDEPEPEPVYLRAASIWQALAAEHPGTAGLWAALATRATATALRLKSQPG